MCYTFNQGGRTRAHTTKVNAIIAKEVYLVKEIMQKLEKMSGNRPIELVERKGEGKKLIEYYGDFVARNLIL